MRAMMDLFIMKKFGIVCLHMWERSWQDKMRTVELNPWTSGRSTSPKERTKTSTLISSDAHMIGPIRNTTTSEKPSTVGLPTRHHQSHANRLHETRNLGVMRRNRVWVRRSVSYPARLCPSGDDCQDVDEVGTEPSSDADSDLFGLDWGDDPVATINSVTERNDRTRGGKELLAFVDSGAVDKVSPKSVCTEYTLEATSMSQSGVGFKGANGSHIKHHGQRRFRVKTIAGSNIEHHLGKCSCAQATDFRQPLARERSQSLYWMKNRRFQCKNGDTIPLERSGSLFAVRLWILKGFHRQG